MPDSSGMSVRPGRRIILINRGLANDRDSDWLWRAEIMRRIPDLLLFFLLIIWGGIAHAQEPIRVGSLYSLTGTMAISESGLKDALLMQVDLQNQRGGLLGRPLQVVSQDPASNWSMYGEKARQLIERENVAAIFGCWTSASRKEVKSVVEELGALLFYPVQYEGREQSPNIIYLGAAPSQQAAWNYFMSIDSPGNRQFISGLRSVIGDSSAVVNDPIEAQAIVFRLWVKAVQWAGTTDPEVVRKTVIGMEVTNLSGGSATLLPNHHLSKPVYIGEIRPDGQYNVMWHSAANVDGNPWFDPTSSDKAQ